MTGAQLGKQQMRMARGGVVAAGGGAAYWLMRRSVFELRLDTLEATMAILPARGGTQPFTDRNTALGTTPEGRLCVVQLGSPFLVWEEGEQKDTVGVHVFSCGDHDGDSRTLLKLKDKSFLLKYRARADERNNAMVKMQWVCEKSGVVFFTGGEIDNPRSDLYAVSLKTQKVERVASNDGDGSLWLWGNLYGYELDQASYLASLAEPKEED